MYMSLLLEFYRMALESIILHHNLVNLTLAEFWEQNKTQLDCCNVVGMSNKLP